MIGDVVLGCKKEKSENSCITQERSFIPLIIAMMGVLFWVKAMSDMEWLLLSPKHVVFGCIAKPWPGS